VLDAARLLGAINAGAWTAGLQTFGRAAGDATRTYLSRSRHDSSGALAVAGGLALGFLRKSLPSACKQLP